jgi:Ca-activated chloride channel homolog
MFGRKILFTLLLSFTSLAACQAPPAPSNTTLASGASSTSPSPTPGLTPSSHSPGQAQGSGGNVPTRAAAVTAADLQSVAQVLEVNVAAWQEPTAPQGNVASLTVVGAEGKPEPLSIDSMEVTVRLEGRLARTEVKQVFRNHLDRQTEGSYELHLPDGAAISRLAMDVDGKMVEGELVERERARLIYESIVRQQKDPALMEWQGGDRFKTQIFPIPAKGTKTVILAYEVMLPETRDGFSYQYALPNLQGQPNGSAIGDLSFTMDVKTLKPFDVRGYDVTSTPLPEGGTRLTLRKQAFVPTGSLEVFFGARSQPSGDIQYAKRVIDGDAQQFFMLDLQPQVPGLSGERMTNLVIALDTSSGLGQAVIDQGKVAALLLFDQMPEGAKLQVIHGDYRVSACADKPFAKSDRDALVACLKPLDAGGATDLGALLGAAADAARAMTGPTSVILFSDGVASLGELDMGLIQARTIATLGPDVSLHAVSVGHEPATADLSRLSRATRGHALRMTPSDLPDAVVSRLLDQVSEPLLTDLHATVLSGDVEHLTPDVPTNLARGEAITVLGRLRSPTAKVKVSGKFLGEEVSQTFDLSAPSNQPDSQLISYFWARAAIDSMDAHNQHRGDVSAMSLKYGVMSKYTSFLVLENDDAFKRFEVERAKEAERLRALAQAMEQELAPDAVATATSTIAATDNEKSSGEDKKKEAKNFQKSDESLQDVLAKTKPEPQRAPSPTTSASAASGAPAGVAPSPPAADMPSFAAEERAAAPREMADKQRAKRRDSAPDAKPRAQEPAKVIANFDGDSGNGPSGLTGSGGGGGGDFAAGGGKGGGNIGGLVGSDGKDSNADGMRNPDRVQPIMVPPKPPEAQSLSEMIATLEATADSLAPYEAGRLVALYIEAKKLDKAKTYLDARLAAFRAQSLSVPDIAQMFRDYRVRTQFPDAFASLNMDLLRAAAGQVGPEVINNIFQGRAAAQQWDALLDDLSAFPLSPAVCTQLIEKLLNLSQPDVAHRLFARVGKHHDTLGKLQIISPNSLRGLFADDRYTLASTRLSEAPGDPFALQTLLELSAGNPDRAEAALNHLETACLTTPLPMQQCRAHLASFSQNPRASQITEKLIDSRLANMRQIRSLDIANPNLIREFASLLRERSRDAEADRLMSEVVEFAPHDYATRLQYAREFETLKRPIDACQAYASAIQLDASQRDTFRTMMGLRRAFPDHADKVRECIVQGVSNLPVKRDVSLVLTWEDPSVDVDMHISEASGEHVDYTHRESKQGGLLYYDITDGFGPEIYVLGHGQKGTYNLEVVYFRGHTQNLKGTLTVIRNVGSPTETRENFDFTLPRADSNKRVPLTSITL